MRKLVMLALLLVGTLGVTQALQLPATLPGTETFDLTAEANGHAYRISVALPEGYADSQAPYPTLYLLDPDRTFGTVTEMARLLAPDELPALLIVGIGYAETSTRSADYDTGDDQFLQFISRELIPYITAHYRTVPADRAIAGYSLGGQFVLNALATKPELFYRYIAISPSVPFAFGKVLAGTDPAFRAAIGTYNLKLFIGSGSLENNKVAERLQAQNYDGLTLTNYIVENGTHRSALAGSLPQGILAVYCGTNDDPAGCALRVRQGR